MRWKNQYSGRWLKKFALFPENVVGETVWLAYYWERYVTLPSKCACGLNAIGKYERRGDNPSSDILDD